MKSVNLMKALLPLLFLALCCAGSWAADSDSLKLVSKAEKEVTVVKEGKKEVKRSPAEKVLPGDVVIFTNHFANPLNKAAENAVITNPLPKDVAYIDGSAFGDGATITFSIDKGKTFETPGKLFKTEKGKKRNARANEYTHIRWAFTNPIPPGKEGDVGYKARIK
jgi:uncharacterized repeat protein (TIGR01451 family)